MAWIRYLLEQDKIQHEYVRSYTNASLIVKDEFAFHDGLFTGYDEHTRTYDKASWDYEFWLRPTTPGRTRAASSTC